MEVESSVSRVPEGELPSGLNEFIWSKVEKDEGEAHSIHRSLYLDSTPEDTTVIARVVEQFSVDRGHVIFSAKFPVNEDLEFPANIEIAKELFQEIESSTEAIGATYTFHRNKEKGTLTSSGRWPPPVNGMLFLAVLADGPVWKKSQARYEPQAQRYTCDVDGSRFLFNYNRELGLFDTVEATPLVAVSNSRAKPTGDPFAQAAAAPSPIRLSAKLVANDERTMSYSVTTTAFQRGGTVEETVETHGLIRDWISGESDSPFTLDFPPQDGDPVVLFDTQQIKAAWKGGSIVRVYDGGVAEELAVARFRRPRGRSWVLVTLVLVVGMCIFAIARPYVTKGKKSHAK